MMKLENFFGSPPPPDHVPEMLSKFDFFGTLIFTPFLFDPTAQPICRPDGSPKTGQPNIKIFRLGCFVLFFWFCDSGQTRVKSVDVSLRLSYDHLSTYCQN